MQIVIDIPEEVLNSIKTFKGKFLCENGYDLIQGIKDGTLLPKGHGDLIDVDCLREDFKASKKISFAERMDISCIVDHAKPIIKVDKAESEDKDADKKCTYKETGCGSCKWQLDCPIEAKTESEG